MVNYKSASLIEMSLASLKYEPIDEIFIWDNASGPVELAALQRMAAADSRIKVFASPVNLGFGPAVNALSDRSSGNARDIVWILNPDTEFFAGSVQVLKDELVRKSVDIISPLIVCGPMDDPTVWFNGGRCNLQTGLCWHDDYGLQDWTGFKELRTTAFMTGAAPMMTREVWNRVGGFHDGLFLYWEDVEFSLRAADLDLSMGVHPGCTVWHMEGGSGPSSSGHSTVYYFYNARNRIRVCAERVGVWNVAIGPGLRETVLTVLRPLVREKVGRVRKSIAAFQGTFDGLFMRGRLGARRVSGMCAGVPEVTYLDEVEDTLNQGNSS
jgi:GT2 family glycosyltransferase